MIVFDLRNYIKDTNLYINVSFTFNNLKNLEANINEKYSLTFEEYITSINNYNLYYEENGQINLFKNENCK